MTEERIPGSLWFVFVFVSGSPLPSQQSGESCHATAQQRQGAGLRGRRGGEAYRVRESVHVGSDKRAGAGRAVQLISAQVWTVAPEVHGVSAGEVEGEAIDIEVTTEEDRGIDADRRRVAAGPKEVVIGEARSRERRGAEICIRVIGCRRGSEVEAGNCPGEA